MQPRGGRDPPAHEGSVGPQLVGDRSHVTAGADEDLPLEHEGLAWLDVHQQRLGELEPADLRAPEPERAAEHPVHREAVAVDRELGERPRVPVWRHELGAEEAQPVRDPGLLRVAPHEDV